MHTQQHPRHLSMPAQQPSKQISMAATVTASSNLSMPSAIKSNFNNQSHPSMPTQHHQVIIPCLYNSNQVFFSFLKQLKQSNIFLMPSQYTPAPFFWCTKLFLLTHMKITIEHGYKHFWKIKNNLRAMFCWIKTTERLSILFLLSDRKCSERI